MNVSGVSVLICLLSKSAVMVSHRPPFDCSSSVSRSWSGGNAYLSHASIHANLHVLSHSFTKLSIFVVSSLSPAREYECTSLGLDRPS
jgi:hypothetical protein